LDVNDDDDVVAGLVVLGVDDVPDLLTGEDVFSSRARLALLTKDDDDDDDDSVDFWNAAATALEDDEAPLPDLWELSCDGIP
jgi:hypothetical protein